MTEKSDVNLEAQPVSAPTPRTRARARHILDNYYIGPARDRSVLEIWAYTDQFSYAPGDRVRLRVSTTAKPEIWEVPEIGRPGALTFGVNGLQGVYANLGNCVGRGPGGFTVYKPEPLGV